MKLYISVILTTICTFFSMFSYSFPYLTLPSGYSKIEDSNGAALYKKSNDFYVIYVDLDISDINSNEVNANILSKYGYNQFYRYNIDKHWDLFATDDTFALVNGQFFDHKTSEIIAPLTYPVVSDYDIINSKSDDSSRSMMTLIKNNDGKYYILEGYKESLLEYNEEVYVGFNKDEYLGDADKYFYTDRTYVGGIAKGNCDPDYASCEMKYLIFLIGNYESRSTMVAELNSLGVHDSAIIRLDGSDSTQFKTESYSFNSGKRKLPNTISISK